MIVAGDAYETAMIVAIETAGCRSTESTILSRNNRIVIMSFDMKRRNERIDDN